MKTKSSKRANLNFHSLRNECLSAQLLEVFLIEAEDGFRVCNLSIEVDYAAYQTIQEEALFNLLVDQVFMSSQQAFEERAIEIDLRLKPQFLPDLLNCAQTPDEIIDVLVQLEPSRKESFLLNSECWLAIAFTQTEPPSPEFEDGSLKSGYQTLWAKPDRLRQQLIASVSTSISTVVAQYLQANGIDYEEANENILRLQYQGQHGAWVCLVKLDETKQQCAVYSVLPNPIPEIGRQACAVMLAYANYDLEIGNFEIDLEDGEVRYRTAIDVDGDRLTPALFEQLLAANVNTMDRFFAELQQFQSL